MGGQREIRGLTFVPPRFGIRTLQVYYLSVRRTLHVRRPPTLHVGDLVDLCLLLYPPPPSLAFRVSTRSHSRIHLIGYISPHLVSCPGCFSKLSLLLTITRTPTVHLSHDCVRSPYMPPMPIDRRASTPQEQHPRPTGA